MRLMPRGKVGFTQQAPNPSAWAASQMAYAAVEPSCTGIGLLNLSTATAIAHGASFRKGPMTKARDILAFVSGLVTMMNSHG